MSTAGLEPEAPADPAVDGAALELTGISKEFPVLSPLLRRVTGRVRAVDQVTLDVQDGETVGLVGESGSGKSTLGRLALRLIEPTSGRVVLAGRDLTDLPPRSLRAQRRHGQMVFQDPYSSLDPRATIADNVGEPLHVHLDLSRKERDARAAELLEEVHLRRDLLDRYPHEFSGGQLQRIALARALATRPRLIIADEPVSSLDVSTQAQMINLLDEIRRQHRLACLFISHDLSVVRHISDRIAVMYLGRIVELGRSESVTTTPKHPYSAALLSSVPLPDPVVQRSRRRLTLRGDLPSPLHLPSGCRFNTRCPFAMDICREVDPDPYPAADGTEVRCHLHEHGPKLAGGSVFDLPFPDPSSDGDRR